MAKLKSVKDLLAHSIKDLYSAETQLVKALPKMAKAASSPELKHGFQTHLEETKVHVERLQKVAELLEITPRGVTCKAMKGLIEEGSEAIEEEGEPTLVDLNLITAAQKVEHYEISGYGSARTLAQAIGNSEIVSLLQETLDEEGNTNKTLTKVATSILKEAPVPE